MTSALEYRQLRQDADTTGHRRDRDSGSKAWLRVKYDFKYDFKYSSSPSQDTYEIGLPCEGDVPHAHVFSSTAFQFAEI